MKKKGSIVVLIFFVFILFISWPLLTNQYDKQNKFYLFVKELIPQNIKEGVKNNFLSELRSKYYEIKNNRLIEKKESQGYQGLLISEKKIKSEDLGHKYLTKEFFLPFKRLDVNLGWKANENSKRAHYVEIIEENIIALSGLGEIIIFKKNNLQNKKLDQKIIPNNLVTKIESLNNKFLGVRDLYYDKLDRHIYITTVIKNTKGTTLNIFKAKFNKDNLAFERLFDLNEYHQNYSVQTGGRLEKFENDKILFSVGTFTNQEKAQDLRSSFGKILSINKKNGDAKIISFGHRNPQGLAYIPEKNIILNSEHGPKGGDEINLNKSFKKLQNFGWNVSSYGIEYDGTDPYKKSHKEFGFVEPFKNFTPSIGISEIIHATEDTKGKSFLYASSLRAGSIYVFEVDFQNEKILAEDRIYFKNQRIRDLKYDKESKSLIAIFELTPSIALIKL